jgi:hypothetical protein
MSGLGIDVSIRDNASDAVRSLAAGLRPEQLNPIVGRYARNAYRTHLVGLNSQRPNALGGKRTQFYYRAARATDVRAEGEFVIVSINQVGIGLRYFGGTVKPKTKKYLTIPAIPEAHGKRASEFGDLHFAFERHPKLDVLMPALVQGAASLIGIRRGPGGARVRAVGERRRRVVFWLAKQATFQPDESVLPHPQQVAAEAGRVVLDYANLLWQRRGGDRGRTLDNGGSE